MNGQLYFEQRPWQQAMDCIQRDALGDIVEVSVHAVCPKGGMDKAADVWRDRLKALLGRCAREDVLRGDGALSIIAAYENDAVVRMFFDDASEDYAENFEIVTKGALIVWKPDAHPQGRALAEGAAFVACTQPFSVELEVQ